MSVMDPRPDTNRIFHEPSAATKAERKAVAQIVEAQGKRAGGVPTPADIKYAQWKAARECAKLGDTFDGAPLLPTGAGVCGDV
jgi:hypothetical protein